MAVVTVGPGNPRLLGNSEAKEALTEMQGMLERCRADAELMQSWVAEALSCAVLQSGVANRAVES